MLILREYFWIDADWVGSSNLATAITLSGPGSGVINVASSPFTVGANGSISGVLVVSLSLVGTGVLSQSTFSLSTGNASSFFTYTPSTIGTHQISTSNNQLLTDTSISYVVSLVPTSFSNGGGGGHKKDDYHPLPDDFWEIRERYLRRHMEPAIKQQHIPIELVELTPAQPKSDINVLLAQRQAAANSARLASSTAALRENTAKTLKLTLDIQRLIDAYYMQAAIILLLDVT